MIDNVKINKLSVSKMILGGNPFSGVAHNVNPEKDLEMKKYYSVARIKETMRKAEELGISTFIGRCDNHIVRVLLEYWDEGGTIQWIAQTCPEYISLEASIRNAIAGGAKACFIHGGQMDSFVANNKTDDLYRAIEQIRNAGLAVGVAGHNIKVFEWAEENLDVDFYMCCYYNPTDRSKQPGYNQGSTEKFRNIDRDKMVQLIQGLKKPAIHYKIFAAGRNDPKEAFDYTAKYLRPKDAICIGVYTKDKPDMLEEDVKLFENSLK